MWVAEAAGALGARARGEGNGVLGPSFARGLDRWCEARVVGWTSGVAPATLCPWYASGEAYKRKARRLRGRIMLRIVSVCIM